MNRIVLIVLTGMIFFSWACKKEKISKVPEIHTSDALSLSQNTAKLEGTIISDGGETILTFGLCWSTSLNPTINDSKTTNSAKMTSSFTDSVVNLMASNTYYIRAYAINKVGVGYGNVISISTLPAVLPTLNTKVVSEVATITANGGGEIISNGGASITERGVCWSQNELPTIFDNKTSDGTGSGTYVSSLLNLENNTTYYVRAYATNIAGTAYGNSVSFQTYGLVDVDGNYYHSIKIGTQEWMTENLKTTHYRNGDPIPNVMDNTQWSNLTSGAYVNYDNDANYTNPYGRLYNFFTLVDSRNLCPTGWHVPTYAETVTLETYLGGSTIAGDKMKETGNAHWTFFNTNATNESGFMALPSGSRYFDGKFNWIGEYCYLWINNEYDASNAYARSLWSRDASLNLSHNTKTSGFSVRCLKD